MMPKISDAERRRAMRVTHQTEIYFKPGKASNQKAFVRDLSQTGSFLVTLERLLAGADVILYVPVELKNGNANTCMLHGQVARVEKKEGVAAFGYGVRFMKLSPGTEKLLKKFLEFRLKEEFGIQPESKPPTKIV